MLILFFDTETSGLPDRDSGPGPHQPHVVQLAAVLADGKDERTLATLIRPAGWEIHPAAQAVHGISIQRASQEGVPIAEAVAAFDELLGQAQLAVAHNVEFDRLLLDSEYVRLGRPGGLQTATHRGLGPPRWPPTFCTMRACTELLRLPGGRDGHWKWPRLEQAYFGLFGHPLAGAHDALADTRACRAIFEELVRRGLGPRGLSHGNRL